MSLSPTPSTAEISTLESQAPIGDDASEADNANDNGTRSVRIPTTAKNTSSLDHDSIEGLMVVHRKKKQRQRFMLPKSAHYVVANSMKHALEIYNNDRTELVYLLSLADAVLSFESDNSNIVMEKCFCVEENQARMLLWVKCIHLAIKRATTLDSELFRSPTTSSSAEPIGRFSDSDENRASVDAATTVGDDRVCASSAVSSGSSPTSNSSFAVARDKLTQRLVIDPAARIVTAGRTMLTPTRTSSVNGERQSLNRWSFMFSHDKQLQTRSPMSSTATDTPSSPVESNPASPKPSPWKRSVKATTDVSSETASNVESVSSSRSRSFRAMSPTVALTLAGIAAATAASTAKSGDLPEKHNEMEFTAVDTKPNPNGSLQVESSQQNTSLELVDDPEPVVLYVLVTMLGVATIAGASDASVFLPLALAGSLAHFYNRHESFSSWTLTSVAVYLASTCNILFGIGTASVFIYIWGYANFKTQRRRRWQRTAFTKFRDLQPSQASIEITHFEVPNWIRHPDVDRVEWLNKVFTTGWPYLKKAIENSVNGSLNPVLDAQKPAFMSSLSLVRLDLGSKAPQISSVKFVSANTLTDEVTLDVEVRVVTDKKSFVADLKMVSHLGAAACLSLRELLLVGTLRITLNPLAKYWPCFGGLNLSFTTRPFFDFSLTAAKINIANVPFVSEWLHTFLYDLLIDYFVWPNVVDIPLWDEHGNPVQ